MKKLVFILCLLVSPASYAALAFEWKNLFYSYIKIQPDYDYLAHATSYMKLFKPKAWEQYKDDEFELDSQRQLAAKEFKQRVAAFNKADEGYALYVNFKFGQYDFEKGVFPVKGLEKSSYYSDRFKEKRRVARGVKLSTTLNVFFANPEKLGDIKMDKVQAKAFLNDRKSRGGNVDRKLPAMLYFKIVAKYKGKKDAMVAILTRVVIYTDKTRKTVLQEF